MLKNSSKVKKILALSVCSGAFFVCGTSASAVIRKTVSSAVGAASRSGVRKTAMGSVLSTWSSHKGKMHKIKSDGASLREQSKSILEKVQPIQGKFTNPSGDEILVNVYTKTSDEGLKVNYVKTTDEDQVVVTHVGDGVYVRSLSLEELRLFDTKNHGLLNLGVDTLGREHIIVVADGNSGGEVAFQFNNGTWRNVHRDKERKIYLGHQVDIDTFSDDLKNTLFGDIKRIIESSSTVGFDVPKTDE